MTNKKIDGKKEEDKSDLEIIIGFECNNNCIFCSNKPLRNICERKGISKTSTKEIKKLIKNNDPKSNNVLFLLGGEPTINKDLFDIIRYAKENGYLRIEIQTNGRMLKNIDYVKKLCKEDISVGVSIHADIAKINDRLTRVDNGFEQLVKGLDNLHSLKKTFSTNTVITKLNYERIPKIIRFLAKYEPSQILFSLVSPVGMDEKTRKEILPNLIEIMPIIKKSTRIASKFGINIKFNDFPICIMNGNEKLMIENEATKDRKVMVKGRKEFFYQKNKNKNEKEKLKICYLCKRKNECKGLWRGYHKLGRDKGIKPYYS